MPPTVSRVIAAYAEDPGRSGGPWGRGYGCWSDPRPFREGFARTLADRTLGLTAARKPLCCMGFPVDGGVGRFIISLQFFAGLAVFGRVSQAVFPGSPDRPFAYLPDGLSRPRSAILSGRLSRSSVCLTDVLYVVLLWIFKALRRDVLWLLGVV